MTTQECLVNCVAIIAGCITFCVFFWLLLKGAPRSWTPPRLRSDNPQPALWTSETRTYYKDPEKSKVVPDADKSRQN